MKRFYKTATIAKAGHGYAIHLDGRTLKTPGKMPLILPESFQAQLIADEWNAQGEDINPALMPCTRLANVACEQTPQNRSQLIEEAQRYIETDLLCYRAPHPRPLMEQQNKAWDPLIEWVRELDIHLNTTYGTVAIEQPQGNFAVIGTYAAELNDLYLTLFVHLTAVFGSVVLSMTVIEKHLPSSKAYELSRLDEVFQSRHWGEDEEAAKRTALIGAEVDLLAKFIK